MKQLNGFLTFTKAICRNQGLIIFAVLAILVAIPIGSFAQITTATIVGTISDPSGAQIPSATVTARNINTGLTRTAVTGEDGFYRLEFLPVGNYEVEVTASSGFKKATQGGIVLRVNDTARVDVTLEVGGADEVVTITTAPPEVNTTSVELGRTVQAEEIENLPLVERNVFALLDLTPGVQSNNSGERTASVTTSDFGLGFPEQRTLINGGTDGGTGSVNYFLDGGVNMTNLRNTGNVAPSPDAVQEFRIQTNSYNAEFGRFASGIVNVLTKSGTNGFHGSLYEFVRNEAFNANEWNSTLDTPKYRRNQFGATIGGPISKDKTFFFFSYSGLRQTTNRFLNGAIVPTARERTGDFSEGNSTAPRDPSTGTSVSNRTPFAGGIIPTNRLDPVALRIINDLIPLPNQPNGRGYQGNVSLPFDTNEFLIKIDHQLNEAHRFTGSFFTTAGEVTVFPGAGNIPYALQNFKYRQSNLNLSDVWVISPNKINQIWATYTRSFGGRLNVPDTTLEDLGSSFFTQGVGSLPDLSVTGFFRASNAIGGPTAGTNFYSIRDVFSWTKGRHSLKLGGEVSLNKDIQETLLNNYGVFQFNNTATGNGLADFLLGIPSRITQDAPVKGYTNTWYTALFVQDDFRVLPNVTLNLGFRWDVQTPPTDPENRVVNYVPGQQSTVNPSAPIGALFFGDPGVERGAIPVSYTHFSPRFGVAWDPKGDGRTSIRAAGGIFYGSISGNEWNTQTNFQPFSTRLTLTNTRNNGTGATLSNPYTNYVGGDPFPYNGTFTNGGGLFTVNPDFKWPRTFQSQISIQRQILRNFSMGAAYVTTIASNLPFDVDINYPVATPTASTSGSNILSRRPNPAFGAIRELQSNQEASYHGLQITGQMRFGKLVTAKGFYTLSKTRSSVQLHNNTTQGLAQNFSNLAAEEGRADTDQRHVFSMSMNFRPDFYSGDNKIAKGILNGWSISPIIKARSGRPFTVTNGNVNANLDGLTNDRAQLIGDPHLDNPTSERWFNIAAFARNLAVTGNPVDGNSPRNFLDGPGFKVVDLALSRDFRFGENVKVRFRAEGTNILNIVNLDQPNSSAPANPASPGNFGRITGANDMRRLQFGFRVTF